MVHGLVKRKRGGHETAEALAIVNPPFVGAGYRLLLFMCSRVLLVDGVGAEVVIRLVGAVSSGLGGRAALVEGWGRTGQRIRGGKGHIGEVGLVLELRGPARSGWMVSLLL